MPPGMTDHLDGKQAIANAEPWNPRLLRMDKRFFWLSVSDAAERAWRIGTYSYSLG